MSKRWHKRQGSEIDKEIPKPVRICYKAWISARTVTYPGLTIGEGALVAEGAVVTKDIALHTTVEGLPCEGY